MIFAGVGFIELMFYWYGRLGDEQGRVAKHEKLSSCAFRRFSLFEWDTAMKQIKLSGRELAVLRAIDYATGNTGTEICDKTSIEGTEVADILNGLCEVGFVEINPYADQVTLTNYADSLFEINPSYALQLKESMRRR